MTLPKALQDALRVPDPLARWRGVCAHLTDAADLPRVAQLLDRFADPPTVRAPSPDTWARIQLGAPLPLWWPLLRALQIDENDLLEGIPLDHVRTVTVSPRRLWSGDDLDSFPALTSLDLTANTVDAAELRQVPSLRRLVLAAATIDNLPALARLPHLDSLDLRHVRPPLEALAGAPALRTLDLSDNPLTDLSALARLPRLTHLSICRCGDAVDPTGLARCSRLESVLHTTTPLDLSALPAGLRARFRT